jgi:hypothetical protein
MVSIAGLLIVHVAIQIALVLDIYLGNGASKQRSEDWFNADSTIAVVAVMSAFVVVDLVALSLILQLLVLHIKLQREGLSTYQFIVRENQRRRDQTKLEHELKYRREVAIKNAIEEGKGCYVFRLENGGFLRESCGLAFCDPLKLEDTDNNREDQQGATTTTSTHNGNGHTHYPSSRASIYQPSAEVSSELDDDDDDKGGDAMEDGDPKTDEA